MHVSAGSVFVMSRNVSVVSYIGKCTWEFWEMLAHHVGLFIAHAKTTIKKESKRKRPVNFTR